MKNYLTLALILMAWSCYSAIICPPDKTISCYESIHNLSIVGSPTVVGGTIFPVRYTDQENTNACNIGTITRTWYIDYNNNNQYDQGEHACIQHITVTYIPSDVEIYWPQDVTIKCGQSIPNENPTWVSGACDLIGLSKQDVRLDIDGNSCYKILRTFKVINWCTHNSSTGTGQWTHTQVIKVIDDSRPQIQTCGNVVIGTDKGCQGTFKVTNSAFDASPCGNQDLLWYAEIDLWDDGSIEYTYSHDNTNPEFKLKPTKNNEEIQITLPWPVNRGYHRVTWRVRDRCGNISSCVQKIQLKDDKAPTPYLHNALHTAFDATMGPLKITARTFDLGSFDNCTQSRWLKYSFSPDTKDTVRMIDCSNAGFQFLRVYVTDLEGNSSFAEVFLLAFDNGSCQRQLLINGTITESNSRPLEGMKFDLMRLNVNEAPISATSNALGEIHWDGISLFKDQYIIPMSEPKVVDRINIQDLKLLQDHYLGARVLKDYEWIAADVDNNRKINGHDLLKLRAMILQPEKYAEKSWVFTKPIDSIRSVNDFDKISSTFLLKEAVSVPQFVGILKGDISEANQIEVEARSKMLLKTVISDHKVSYYLPQNVDINGLQFEITGLEAKVLEIQSSYIKDLNYEFDGKTYRIIGMNNANVNIDRSILDIIVDSPIIPTDQFSTNGLLLTKSDKLIELNTSLSRMSSEATGLYPNPTNGTIYLSGLSDQLISIYSIDGRKIEFLQDGVEVIWSAYAGIYNFIIKDKNNEIKSYRVIKL